MVQSIKQNLAYKHLSRTKIIATLGPATDNLETLSEMIKNGVSVARLNFSHGSVKDHQKRVNLIKAASKRVEKTVAIMADLQGQKIRIARFKNSSVELKEGQDFILDCDMNENEGDETRVGLVYPDLIDNVKVGDVLLLDDGMISLVVSNKNKTEINCKVKNGGTLANNKGINKKGGGFSAGALTDKDKEDIKEAVKMDVDFIAVSFVRDAEDIKQVRELLKEQNSQAGIIAKIERVEAINDIDNIIEVSDAVMIARGDLGIEMGDHAVPFLQKQIIQTVRDKNKIAITATQMMNSMIESPVPTRAEVCDIANAIIDGTDAVMLSGETSVGNHPVKVIEKMNEICLESDKSRYKVDFYSHKQDKFQSAEQAIAFSTIHINNRLDVKAVISFTVSGQTPLYVSRTFCTVPIYAICVTEKVMRKMAIYQGVIPVIFDFDNELFEDKIEEAIQVIIDETGLQKGDHIVITKGEAHRTGGTNTLKVLTI